MRRRLAAVLVLAALAGCDSALAPLDASAGVAVASEAELLAAQAAWQAARPAFYRYAYSQYCEECPSGDQVGVRGGRVVETTFIEAASARTLDDLFETARGVFRPGYGGEIRLSQTEPRFPVYVRVGRTTPEEFPTSDVGLIVTVTAYEAH
ncbi:MAG TPA: hypothetical protein VF594_05915 [Rubricoccaceae bacterium]